MINLFINKKTKKQPKDRNEQADSILHDGLYQIPIFCQPFKKQPEENFYVDSCYKYDKLPASSVLVRINRAAVTKDGRKVLSINTPGYEKKKIRKELGIWVLAPNYNTGAYNSELCQARQTEIDLAAERRKRPPVEVKSVVLEKLKPIYEYILVVKKDEEEIAKLPPKLQEAERKKRQAARSNFSLMKLPEKNSDENPQTSKDPKAEPDNKDDKKNENQDGKNEESNQPIKDDKKKEQKDEDNKKDEGPPANSNSKLAVPVEEPKKDQDPKNIPPSLINLQETNKDGKDPQKSKKELEEEEEQDNEAIFQIIDTVFDYTENMEFLNLKFFSKYNEKNGAFKFIIDGLHKLTKSGFYITSYTLNPPAKYYLEEKKEDIKIYSTFDWDRSTTSTTFYNEGYIKYKEIPFNTNLHFLIELYSVEMPAFADPEIKPVAWTILPVFVIDQLSKQGYVSSNIYQLPLFQGKITKEIAAELNGTEPWPTLMKMVDSGRAKYWSNASVYCRLLDTQREGHFQKSFDFERASEEYLPESKASSYRFLRDDEEKIMKKKASFLRSKIPYQEDPYNFNKRLTEICCKEFGIEIEE